MEMLQLKVKFHSWLDLIKTGNHLGSRIKLTTNKAKNYTAFPNTWVSQQYQLLQEKVENIKQIR